MSGAIQHSALLENRFHSLHLGEQLRQRPPLGLVENRLQFACVEFRRLVQDDVVVVLAELARRLRLCQEHLDELLALLVQKGDSALQRRNREADFGCIAKLPPRRFLLFPPGRLFGIEAPLQDFAKQRRRPKIPVLNFSCKGWISCQTPANAC